MATVAEGLNKVPPHLRGYAEDVLSVYKAILPSVASPEAAAAIAHATVQSRMLDSLGTTLHDK